MNYRVQKALPIIFSVLGSAGVIGTAILAVKNSKKYDELDGDFTKKEKAKNLLKSYWPTILLGTATIGSITAGTIISKKVEASLSAAVIMLERSYNRYQGKVKEILGVDKHKKILTEISKDTDLPTKRDDKILYFNDYIGHFYARQEDVTRAINNINIRVHNDNQPGYSTIKDFVEDSKAEILDDGIYKIWKDYGWSAEYIYDTTNDIIICDGYNNNKEGEPDVKVLVFVTANPVYLPNEWSKNKSEKFHGEYIQSDEIELDDIAYGVDTDYDEEK